MLIWKVGLFDCGELLKPVYYLKLNLYLNANNYQLKPVVNNLTKDCSIDPMTTMTSSRAPSISFINKLKIDGLDTLLIELKDNLKSHYYTQRKYKH